jgi:hypothetical protein
MYVVTLYQAYAGRTVAALATVSAVAVFLYGALLLGAVSHAAGRTQAERELRSLGSSLGALESQYLAQTRAISPERAAAMGFVAPQSVSVVFAQRAPGLTLR